MKAQNRNQIALLKARRAEKAAQIKALRTEMYRTSCRRTRSRVAARIDNALVPKMRQMNLAYAFLRGVPYKAVENSARSAPNWKLVKELVDKYGVRTNWDLPNPHARSLYKEGLQNQNDHWEFWLAEAKAHYEANRIS